MLIRATVSDDLFADRKELVFAQLPLDLVHANVNPAEVVSVVGTAPCASRCVINAGIYTRSDLSPRVPALIILLCQFLTEHLGAVNVAEKVS